MNDLYAEFAAEGGSMLATVVTKLAAPDRFDLTDVDSAECNGISPPWNDWSSVQEQCRSLAAGV